MQLDISIQLLEPMLPGAQILGEDAAERGVCTVNPATRGDSVRHVHLAILLAPGLKPSHQHSIAPHSFL